MRTNSEIKRLCDDRAKERAKLIGAAAWYECYGAVLTAEEEKEVRAVWDSLPGWTCAMDAFFEWLRRREPGWN